MNAFSLKFLVSVHSRSFIVHLTWNDLEQKLAGFVSVAGMLGDSVTRQEDGTLQNTRSYSKLQKTNCTQMTTSTALQYDVTLYFRSVLVEITGCHYFSAVHSCVSSKHIYPVSYTLDAFTQTRCRTPVLIYHT